MMSEKGTPPIYGLSWAFLTFISRGNNRSTFVSVFPPVIANSLKVCRGELDIVFSIYLIPRYIRTSMFLICNNVLAMFYDVLHVCVIQHSRN